MTSSVRLNVRGEIPAGLSGSLIVAASRRDKRRDLFSRWQDSRADLVRIDLSPGRPGRAVARILEIDPGGIDLGSGFRRTDFDRSGYGSDPRYGYATQPNHGLNISGDRLWATNLLFGAPLEIDLRRWRASRILRFVDPAFDSPRVTGSSHFAWSRDGRFAFFHQSLMRDNRGAAPASEHSLKLVRIDRRANAERVWDLLPPVDDCAPHGSNFHSVFYFEESGRPHIGMLRTGAVVEDLAPHSVVEDHRVEPMTASTIWIVYVDESTSTLRASLLPGIRELDGIALSHLDVDNTDPDGFVLFANFKEADVAEETHGDNVYGEPASSVHDHYCGMTVQPLNVGQVIRVERRNGRTSVVSFRQPYDAGRTSLGHTWLPINIELDESREFVFCTFAGVRPRLLSKHLAAAYPDRCVDASSIWYVPPLLMRLDAKTLRPTYSARRDYLSYAEPVAMCVIGRVGEGYVCTFSPELGLRIYRSDDLSEMVAHVMCHPIWHCGDAHFRPEPAHMSFVRI